MEAALKSCKIIQLEIKFNMELWHKKIDDNW